MFAEKLLPLDLQALQIFQVHLFLPNPSQVHSHCLKLILMIQLLGVSPLKSACHPSNRYQLSYRVSATMKFFHIVRIFFGAFDPLSGDF